MKIQISALKGENIDELLETVMLVAEVSSYCNMLLFKNHIMLQVRLFYCSIKKFK